MSKISPRQDPGLFKEVTLSNGIRVFHRPSEQVFGAPKLSMCVLLSVGGRDDLPGKEGAAHFFEHMPFRGTTRYPSLYDLTYLIENNGGYINAFTSDEATGYEITVPSELAEEGISRLADMLMNPCMREPEIEIERSVILEELRNKLANVTFFARRELYKGLLGNHPLVSAVIGTEEALKSITKADLEQFHATFYNANNLSLFFAGTYDEASLIALSKKYLEPIMNGTSTNHTVDYSSQVAGEYARVLTPDKYNRSVYVLGRTMPPASLCESWLVKLFIDMLSRGMNSPLDQEIREKRGLAYNLSLHHEHYHDVSALTFFVSTQYKNMNEVDTIAWEEINKVLNNPGRFEEVKHMIHQAILHREFSIHSLVDGAIDTYLDYGRVIPLSESLNLLESLQLSDVKDYMSAYLQKDNFINIRVNCDQR